MKKTDYPDLERLPNTNFWKHLLNYIWNKPRWIAEELYEKYFFSIKKDLELEMLRQKVKELELQININKIIQEADNITKLPNERTIK
tara:strand:+ start:1907 stop:2167 length:261 start_codon:yes stop_codon:yes gene_type:complete